MLKILLCAIAISASGCLYFNPTPEQLYEYCLTDMDVRKRAAREGIPVEDYCYDLLDRAGEAPPRDGCSDGQCKVRFRDAGHD